MKPTSTWSWFVLIYLNLLPFVCSQVKNPKIVQISDSLPSKKNQIGIHHGRRMIGSLPRSRLIGIGTYLSPQFSVPIQYTKSIKPSFVIPSSTDHNERITLLIIMSSTIRSERRYISSSFMLFPNHSLCVKTPQIIHVERILIK